MCYWEVQVACLIENLARCIVQSALIAVTNVKFRSNLILAGQSIVEIVGQKEDEQVVSVTRRLRERIVLTFLLSHFLNSKNCNHQLFPVWCTKIFSLR
jgi:predicted acyltransferase